jgi:hypothetical protein
LNREQQRLHVAPTGTEGVLIDNDFALGRGGGGGNGGKTEDGKSEKQTDNHAPSLARPVLKKNAHRVWFTSSSVNPGSNHSCARAFASAALSLSKSSSEARP